MSVKTGAIVDATIIAAPSSTKNAERACEAEMHQTRRDQQWYFGMKRPLGVDSHSGLAHSAVVTPANVHDKHALQLLHGQEKRMCGDNACRGQKALIRAKALQAKDFTNERVRCRKDGRATKSDVPKTGPTQKCGPRSSLCLPWSSDCGDSRRWSIAGWSRMPAVPSPRWHWPTSTRCVAG